MQGTWRVWRTLMLHRPSGTPRRIAKAAPFGLCDLCRGKVLSGRRLPGQANRWRYDRGGTDNQRCRTVVGSEGGAPPPASRKAPVVCQLGTARRSVRVMTTVVAVAWRMVAGLRYPRVSRVGVAWRCVEMIALSPPRLVACLCRSWDRGRGLLFSGLDDDKISDLPAEGWRGPPIDGPTLDGSRFARCPPVLRASIPGQHYRQLRGLAREGIETAQRPPSHDDAKRFHFCHTRRISVVAILACWRLVHGARQTTIRQGGSGSKCPPSSAAVAAKARSRRPRVRSA